jgi:hypothetical protein
MAKQVFLTNQGASAHRGNNDPNLLGTAVWWNSKVLSEIRGVDQTGNTNVTANTVTGPSVGIELGTGGGAIPEWLSEPLSADFTIAGTITLNLWCAENSMTANIAINAVIDKVDGATGALTRIATSANATEMALTTPAAQNFTVTPTSTVCKRGDRLRVRVFIDDGGGTMATGFTGTCYYDRNTAAVQGDSWVQFTENLTFEAVGAPGILEQTANNNAANFGDNVNQQIAQSFVASSSSLSRIAFILSKVGSPSDNVIAEIQTNSAGKPSGTVVASLGTVAGGSIPSSSVDTGMWFGFTGPWALTQGNTYWLVLRRSGAQNASVFYQNYCSSIIIPPWIAYQTFNGTTWSAGTIVFGISIIFDTASIMYLTDTAETINPGSSTEKKALKTRGSGSVNSVTNAINGPTPGVQVTDVAAGTTIEWYTPPLQAFTLGGKAGFSIHALVSTTTSRASLRAEIAVCNNDGTGAVVWGSACQDNIVGQIASTTDVRIMVWPAGDDIAVSTGQRLRFRIYTEDGSIVQQQAFGTITVAYNGATAGAVGDTYVVLPQAIVLAQPGVSSGTVAATSTVGGSIRLAPVTRLISPTTVISATSVASGRVAALHRITPTTTIAATSAVSGAVGRVKKVTPTTAVAATSTVSGSIARIAAPKQLVAGTISATSTVSGSVRATHLIRPTTVIAATSTVSGSVIALRKIAPTTVTATSVVSGAIGRIRKVVTANILATSVVGLSSIQGSFVVIRRLQFGTIAATSTVSGALSKQAGVIKPLTTATISATSTVSGNVTALRKVAPATVAATSVVSGSVRATHLIAPTTVIAATSTVSGNVRPLRRIAPTTIAATSTVAGTVSRIGVTRPIAPTLISATSTVAGSVAKLPRVTPTTSVAATSTVSGSVRATHVLVANVNAASTVTGLIRVTRAVRLGVVNATSVVSGSVRVTHLITPTTIIAATSTVAGVIIKQGTKLFTGGVVSATSVVSGSVRAIHKISPVTIILATSTVSGSIQVIRRVIPTTVAATSVVSGSLRRLLRITPAQVSATSVVSGRITAIHRITATTITATSIVTGVIQKAPVKAISGIVAATSTVSGKIIFVRRLPITSVSATSTVTGSVRVIHRLLPTTSVLATSTVSGQLRRVHPVPLIGNVLATSTVAGAFVSAPKGSVIYHAQSGTITMGKTGRIDYKMTGNLTWAKTGEIEPDTVGVSD